MTWRHEWKHELARSDLLLLRPRLRAALRPDEHGENGRYTVHSLYFDTPGDKALREKLDGVSRREKFRLRYYDGDTELLRLEKKIKNGGLGTKLDAPLTRAQVAALLSGDLSRMEGGAPLVRELHSKMRRERLVPKTVVRYAREAYCYPAGNVRVTLDYDIRTDLGAARFLEPEAALLPAAGDPVILEVKWDGFLPDLVRDIVQLGDRRAAAFSKYAACRIYG